MRYILTGGGSGGHIYPLLSFAEVVKTIDKDAEFLFVGKKDKMEAEIVPATGMKFVAISTTGTKGRISWQNVKAVTSMGIGYLQAQKIIKDFQPDVCLGGGGYVSAPLMFAAINSKKSIVTAVLESDQFMGKANLQLAKKADLVFGGLFDLKTRYFATNNHYYHVGHPRMQELYQQYASAIETKATSDKVEHILFIGGSLGAQTINEQAIALCQFLAEQNRTDLQVTLITGKRYYDEYKDFATTFTNLTVVPYAEQLASYYLQADLLISRASAGVLAEATTFRLPTIAIPSPNVMRNHQFYNAEYFVERDAGMLYEEDQIHGTNFVKFILEVSNNSEQLKSIKHNLQNLMHKDAVTQMHTLIKNVREEK